MTSAPAPALADRLIAALWLDLEGSTRQLALLRIAAAMLLWSSWGFPFILHFDLTPARVALALAFYGGALLLFLGLWSRLSAAVVALALAITSVTLGRDAPDIWLLQHRQLTAGLAVILALGPCGRSLSLDRWRALAARGSAAVAGLEPKRVGDEAALDERGPLWTLRLLQLCSTVILLATALGQLSSTWLTGQAFVTDSGDIPTWAPVVAWTVLLGNLLGALGPWWRRTRALALTLVPGLYLLLYPLMAVDTVSLVVCLLLFSFVPPERVHRAIDRLHGAPAGAES